MLKENVRIGTYDDTRSRLTRMQTRGLYFQKHPLWKNKCNERGYYVAKKRKEEQVVQCRHELQASSLSISRFRRTVTSVKVLWQKLT
jgi:hypothetical protein